MTLIIKPVMSMKFLLVRNMKLRLSGVVLTRLVLSVMNCVVLIISLEVGLDGRVILALSSLLLARKITRRGLLVVTVRWARRMFLVRKKIRLLNWERRSAFQKGCKRKLKFIIMILVNRRPSMMRRRIISAVLLMLSGGGRRRVINRRIRRPVMLNKLRTILRKFILISNRCWRNGSRWRRRIRLKSPLIRRLILFWNNRKILWRVKLKFLLMSRFVPFMILKKFRLTRPNLARRVRLSGLPLLSRLIVLGVIIPSRRTFRGKLRDRVVMVKKISRLNIRVRVMNLLLIRRWVPVGTRLIFRLSLSFSFRR